MSSSQVVTTALSVRRYAATITPILITIALFTAEIGAQGPVRGHWLIQTTSPQNDALLKEADDLENRAKVLLSQGNPADAIPLAKRALELRERTLGANNEKVATSILNLSYLYKKTKNYESARTQLNRLSDIAAVVFGPRHVRMGMVLHELAQVNILLEDFVAARSLTTRAIDVLAENLGPDTPDLAAAIFDLAEKWKSKEQYEDAIALYKRSLSIYEAKLPPTHSYITVCLQELSDSYRSQRKYAAAQPLLERALRNLEQTQPPGSAETVSTLYELASLLEEKGDYEAAQPMIARVLDFVEKGHGAGDPITAGVIQHQADLYYENGNYLAAKSFYERALSIREKTKPASKEVADSLSGLAAVLANEGDLATAREKFVQAANIKEKVLGPDDPSLGRTLEDLGFLFLKLGDGTAARPLFDRVFTINEKTYGANSPEVATILEKLGAALIVQWDYAQARPILERALRIYETSVKDEQSLARTLDLLAMAMRHLGGRETAIAYEERALAIREKSDRVENAERLIERADLLREKGDYKAARSIYERVIKAFSDQFGPDRSPPAVYLDGLASVLEEQREYTSAQALRERTLKSRLEKFGSEHPNVGASYYNLGHVAFMRKDMPLAQQHFLKAAAVFDLSIKKGFPYLSLAEQRVFLQSQVSSQLTILLSTCREGALLEQAYGFFVGWKGLLVESLRRQSSLTRLNRDPLLKLKLDRLQALRAQIVAWNQNISAVPPNEWSERLKLLTSQKEAVERELTRAAGSGSSSEPLSSVSLAEMRASLQDNEVYVDIYRYSSLERPSPDSYNYAVVVMGAKDGPVLLDMGPSKALESALSAWRRDVLGRDDASSSWQSLLGLTWKRIASVLPKNTRRIWLCPDAELSRVPWHLMAESAEDNEIVRVMQVNSAREFIALRHSAAPTTARPQSLLLAGNVEYGPVDKIPQTSAGQTTWQPLKESEDELKVITQIAKKGGISVTPLSGANVSKETIWQKLPNSSYAHFSTHGFFTRKVSAPGTRESEDQSRYSRNPLVESGIVLSGANVVDPKALDAKGILTAEQIIELDLHGLDLITLSACETGRGEEVTGQGVLGLRSSLMASGARSILISLWKVPDEPTMKFMEAFYTNLWIKKLDRLEALVLAQRAVRDDSSGLYKDPVNWAAWVLVGESAR